MRGTKQFGFIVSIVAAGVLVQSAGGAHFVRAGDDDVSSILGQSDSLTGLEPCWQAHLFFTGPTQNSDLVPAAELLSAAPCRWEALVHTSVSSRLKLPDFARVSGDLNTCTDLQVLTFQPHQARTGGTSRMLAGRVSVGEVGSGTELLGSRQLSRTYSDLIVSRFSSAAAACIGPSASF